jgi:hypothetical protein
MARPQVLDGRPPDMGVAASISTEQSQIADKRCLFFQHEGLAGGQEL